MRAGDKVPGDGRARTEDDAADLPDRAWVDGVEIPITRLGTNDGLNFGRFPDNEALVSPYTLRIPLSALLERHAEAFDRLVAEMREDDRLDGGPSALGRMGYPTLREALGHPQELAEVISVHLDREILQAAAPLGPESRYVISSTDRVVVTADTLVIGGRAFRRRS